MVLPPHAGDVPQCDDAYAELGEGFVDVGLAFVAGVWRRMPCSQDSRSAAGDDLSSGSRCVSGTIACRLSASYFGAVFGASAIGGSPAVSWRPRVVLRVGCRACFTGRRLPAIAIVLVVCQQVRATRVECSKAVIVDGTRSDSPNRRLRPDQPREIGFRGLPAVESCRERATSKKFTDSSACDAS